MWKLFATAVRVSLTALCLTVFYARANAATLLFSSVTENSSGLYTYNYLIDNTAGASSVYEVNILVSPQNLAIPSPPLPVSYTAPYGWFLQTAGSGSIADPPYNECCGFYQFAEPYSGRKVDPLEIPMGAILGGFSFSVYAPPSQFSTNNYFLFGDPVGVTSYGFTLAPEISTTPLPDTLPLFATGLGLIGMLGWWRKRENRIASA
jgi:hypothetical protein